VTSFAHPPDVDLPTFDELRQKDLLGRLAYELELVQERQRKRLPINPGDRVVLTVGVKGESKKIIVDVSTPNQAADALYAGLMGLPVFLEGAETNAADYLPLIQRVEIMGRKP
jgi:hypothetical protein